VIKKPIQIRVGFPVSSVIWVTLLLCSYFIQSPFFQQYAISKDRAQLIGLLPSCVRLIQGDGISASSIEAILEALKAREISADNIAFGMGAELLQKVNRDTQKFAMKASAICINGEWKDVYKDPITDPGKRSKRGRLALVKTDAGFKTIPLEQLGQQTNQLSPIFRNGILLKEWTLDEVRAQQ
jgi:nicotinamide phosphoribosyltransferase